MTRFDAFDRGGNVTPVSGAAACCRCAAGACRRLHAGPTNRPADVAGLHRGGAGRGPRGAVLPVGRGSRGDRAGRRRDPAPGRIRALGPAVVRELPAGPRAGRVEFGRARHRAGQAVRPGTRHVLQHHRHPVRSARTAWKSKPGCASATRASTCPASRREPPSISVVSPPGPRSSRSWSGPTAEVSVEVLER